MKINEKIVNVITGEEVIVEKEMPEADKIALQLLQQESENEKVLLQEFTTKRQALLNKLGITEEEARLLLGGN